MLINIPIFFVEVKKGNYVFRLGVSGVAFLHAIGVCSCSKIAFPILEV